MTVTEREEEVSKAKNEQMKKEKAELNELDSDRQDVNADDEFMDDSDELVNSVMNEDREEPKSSRTRIGESEEVKRGSGRALDPLDTAMEIVRKYHEFVVYIFQMLKEERKDEEMEMEKWSKVIERGKHLVESLEERMKRMPDEMERMKNDENLQKEYSFRKTHIGDIIANLHEINSRIESSPQFGVVSDLNHREFVLPQCLDVLKYCNEELSELEEVITELKEIDKEEETETETE